MVTARGLRIAATCLALALAVATGPASAGTVVKVSLTDTTDEIDTAMRLGMGLKGDMSKATMFVKADKTDVLAGEVTFQVKNDSGKVIHEMLVAAVKSTDDLMPFNDNEARVDEEKSADLGEVAELEPGKGGALTVTLKPGTYILYCNIPGHYMAGMWAVVTAK